MFEVRVRLFANLKEIAGSPSLALKFDRPPTIRDVINTLILIAPQLEKYLVKNGTFNNRYKILVGSEEMPAERFVEPLRTGEISILPPVSGG